MIKTGRIATFFPAVLFLATIGFVATDIYLPSFPSIQKELHTQRALVKLTLSLYLLGFAAAQLISGPYSERFGRKKMVIIGLSISLLGTLICFFSAHIHLLILGRVVQGIGLGFGSTLWRAILRDVFSGDDLAHFSSFISVGTAALMAMAPTLGGYIQYFLGWRTNFMVILIYTILGLVLVFLWLSETHQEQNHDSTKWRVVIQNYLHLLKNPIFMGYSLCVSLSFGGLSAYFASSPFLFQEVMGLNSRSYGLLAFFIGAGLCVGGFLNAFLVRLWGRHHTLLLGIFFVFFSGAIMLFFGLLGILNTLVVMLPMGVFTLGGAMVFANAFANAFQPFGKIAGFAGALYGSFQFLGGALLSALMSLLRERNQIPLAGILIAVGISCYLLQRVAFSCAMKQK